MLDIPKLGDEDSQYDGSRLFAWLADLCGLSVDLVNFLLSQIFALFLASLYRSLLHPSKVPSGIRHAFGLCIGLCFGYFCFGQQAIHIAGLPALCYIVIRTQNPQIVQRIVMVVSLIYLSCVHLHRLYYDYASYSLDITGPLMIITQKVTSLAFSIHDGLSRDEKELSKSQQYHAVRKLPSALEYFSYVFYFQGLLAGPMVFYRDYMEFIEGYQMLKHAPSSNGDLQKNFNRNRIIVEPSPMKSVVTKVIGSLICVIIFMKFIAIYPIKTIKDHDFLENSSFIYKFWFMMMATTVIRFKYYHAWLLADAICNSSGLGFNGYDANGNAKWDLASNINVLSFEFATNMRNAINNWNLGTNRWLRGIIYERTPKKYGTLLTFCLSALWHGFYPGYYVTFASGALAVMAARTARKLIRHRFQHTKTMQLSYDILTLLTTRLFMGYLTFPFVLLELTPSLRMYLKVYMCLHLVALFTTFVLPKFVHGEQKSSTSSSMLHNNTSHKTNLTLIANKKNKNKAFDNNNLLLKRINCRTTINDTSTPSTDGDFIQNANGRRTNDITIGVNGVDILNSNNSSNKNSCSSGSNDATVKSRNKDFLDKTVTGLVEFKDDLMRMDETHAFGGGGGISSSRDVLRKRITIGISTMTTTTTASNITITAPYDTKTGGHVDTFIKKEIESLNAAVKQTNMLPAVVLSNGHAK